MNEIKDAEIITEDSITEEIVDNNVTLVQEASSLNDIVELTNEQQAEMNMMELIKKDLYPTINNEEKELLDKYDILKTGMAGINKAVEDVYKGELSKFVEKEIDILNTLYTSSPSDIKLRRLVETDEGDLAKKEKEYTEYSLDDEFMSDDANFGILTYLREELELGSKVIENYTVTVDNVKYYLKDLYLSLMDEKEGDNTYRLFTPNIKVIKESLLDALKITDIKSTDADGEYKGREAISSEVNVIDTKIDTYLYLLSFPTKIEIENYTEFTSKYAYVTAIHLLFNEEEVLEDFTEILGYYKSKYNKDATIKIDYKNNRIVQSHMIKGALKDVDKRNSYEAYAGLTELVDDTARLLLIALSAFINKNSDINGLITQTQEKKPLFDRDLEFLIESLIIKRYRKGFNNGILKLIPSLYSTMYNTLDKNYFFTVFFSLSNKIAAMIKDNTTEIIN